MNLGEQLKMLRTQTPLIHNITNYVVMNYTANALLAIGASPVMAHAIEEVEEMVAIANALVINIGTLSTPWLAAMKLAAIKANLLGKPFILDPVGAGASTFRNNALQEILDVASPTIIRGNASEIMALAGIANATKGVDSTSTSNDAISAAHLLVDKYGCVISVSGEIDIIVDRNRIAYIANGKPVMAKITGMGCAATAIAAAFASVVSDPFEAAVAAAATMGVCGDLAHAKSVYPGSFQIHFLDKLMKISAKKLNKNVNLAIENH